MSDTATTTIWTVGRRKTASARVRLIPNGTGKITVNGKEGSVYLYEDGMLRVATLPLRTVEAENQFDVIATITGGGPMGQSTALSHGIARGLEKFNPEWRAALKKAGLLTRDPRRRERGKPGQPGARKRFQFSKR